MTILRIGVAMTLALALPAAAAAQQCLHGADETAEQKTRRQAALGAARQINTLQMNRPERRQGEYLGQAEMAAWYGKAVNARSTTNPLIFDPAGEVIPGWKLTLDKTEKGYWFMIMDKTDPCGFAYVSSEAGIIYSAEPIR